MNFGKLPGYFSRGCVSHWQSASCAKNNPAVPTAGLGDIDGGIAAYQAALSDAVRPRKLFSADSAINLGKARAGSDSFAQTKEARSPLRRNPHKWTGRLCRIPAVQPLAASDGNSARNRLKIRSECGKGHLTHVLPAGKGRAGVGKTDFAPETLHGPTLPTRTRPDPRRDDRCPAPGRDGPALLAQFAANRDESAFRGLIQLYGPSCGECAGAACAIRTMPRTPSKAVNRDSLGCAGPGVLRTQSSVRGQVGRVLGLLILSGDTGWAASPNDLTSSFSQRIKPQAAALYRI
jgi:hypothetical protein